MCMSRVLLILNITVITKPNLSAAFHLFHDSMPSFFVLETVYSVLLVTCFRQLFPCLCHYEAMPTTGSVYNSNF